VSCHNGSSATGKIPTHIATTSNCQSCHTTVAWLPVRIVDHTQVIGTCFSCHNGQIATGKPPTHVPTSAGCESCHTTNAWTPARFDHKAVAPHTCATCHNAVKAAGMPRTHIPTTQACDVCHGTLAWKPAKVDHSTFTTACARCHNNLGAVGIPTGHMSTRIDCGTCHSYPDWSALHFRHISAAYPGTHRAALSCISCHSSSTDQIPWRSPANAGSCAGCHAADFKRRVPRLQRFHAVNNYKESARTVPPRLGRRVQALSAATDAAALPPRVSLFCDDARGGLL
jgi:hypothetical protein